MTPKLKKQLQKILICLAVYAVMMLCPHLTDWPQTVWIVLYGILYLVVSWNVLKKTWKNIKHKDFMDENFLMAVASIGAFILGEFSESVAVMLFYMIGEWFEHYAVGQSRKNITSLMDIAPEYANLEVDGKVEKVDPDNVQIGQTIVIQPGERVPLDGIIISGNSALDTAALTGESVPRMVHPDDQVISGTINQNGVLKVRVTKVYEDSTVAKILDLVENATDKKSRSEQFITKFAKIYTPVVVYSAIVLAIVPSLITGQWSTWVYRALEFLVISCPCALVISVPLAFFGGIGGASRCGILVKGSNYLQTFSEVTTMVFDKTGTLTKGTFDVTQVEPLGMDSQTLLQYAGAAESYSTHPIALSIMKAAGMNGPQANTTNVQELAGKGIIAQVGEKSVAIGNEKLMASLNIPTETLSKGDGLGTVAYVAVDGQYAGLIEIADQIKEDAKVVFDLLRKQGVKKFVMLTGDQLSVAQAVAKKDGIDEVHAQLLPDEKVEWVEKLIQSQPPKEKLAYIGDGINDAPVLTRADVGVAMGGLGSDAAIEAADIVLMDDQLSSLLTARKIAGKTLRISYQNITFALLVKVTMLVLGSLGLVNMWGAVFADVGVSVLCILNSVRALHVKKESALRP